jgi:hypothetical protein
MNRAIYSLLLIPLCACSDSYVAAADRNVATSTQEARTAPPTELELRARELQRQYDAIMEALAEQSYSVTEELDRLLDSVCAQQRDIEAQLASIDAAGTEGARIELERSFERVQADIARTWELVSQ